MVNQIRCTTITRLDIDERYQKPSKCDVCNCDFMVYDEENENFCPGCGCKILKLIKEILGK